MKTKSYLLAFVATVLITACGRFGNKDNKADTKERIVCISKQYNEIIWELGAQQNIVGVDLSSIYPPDVQKLPNVGYHRDLSVEGILSLKPTLIIHDNNVGPETVMKQVADVKIPIKTFPKDGDSIEGTKALIRELGAYFHKEHEADSLCKMMDAGIQQSIANANQYTDSPRVAIIHFGRIGSGSYLMMTNNSTGGKLIDMAGGKMAIEGERGMMRLSAEVLSKADPDVILVTDFGYDRLGGNIDGILTLPGVSTTKAAKNKKIYRVWEHDLVYLGPHTGEVIMNLQKLIHSNNANQ
ncbi:MAG TPA: ABC transporter substrate-binding protein [Chitinophagales bacterium]|nr:ABC transporter substrate-binding protein [Chitinophagales bacterium]